MKILKKLTATKNHWRAVTGAAAGFMLISAIILQLISTAHTQPLSVEIVEADAPLMAIPGSRVSLIPPSGFVLAHRFRGYQAGDNTANIIVNDTARYSFQQMLASLAPDKLLRSGQEIQSSEVLTIDGRSARLIRAVHRTGGRNLQRWFLVVQDGSSAVMISVTGHSGHLLDDQVVNSLQTLTLKDEPAPRLTTDSLNFEIPPAEGFQAVRVQEGTRVWFSKAGTGASNKAYFVVDLSARNVCDEMLLGANTYIQRAAKKIEGVNLILEQTEKPVGVLGFEGLESVGRGFDPTTGKRLMTYQAAAIDDCAFYRLIGVSPFEDMAEYLPLFQQMTASLRLNQIAETTEAPEGAPDPGSETLEPRAETIEEPAATTDPTVN